MPGLLLLRHLAERVGCVMLPLEQVLVAPPVPAGQTLAVSMVWGCMVGGCGKRSCGRDQADDAHSSTSICVCTSTINHASVLHCLSAQTVHHTAKDMVQGRLMAKGNVHAAQAAAC